MLDHQAGASTEIEGVCEASAVEDWLATLNGHLVLCGMCGPRTGKITAANPPGQIPGCPSLCPECRDDVGPLPARSEPPEPIGDAVIHIIQAQIDAAVLVLRRQHPTVEMLPRVRKCWVKAVIAVLTDARKDDPISQVMDYQYITSFARLPSEEQDQHAPRVCSFWSFYRLVINRFVSATS